MEESTIPAPRGQQAASGEKRWQNLRVSDVRGSAAGGTGTVSEMWDGTGVRVSIAAVT
jgi:hypothetical protein